MLAGLALIFAQLTQAQGIRPAGHPIVPWSYGIFDGAVLVSLLAAVAGGLPLWLLMLRRASRQHSARAIAYLMSPVVVPVGYLGTVGAIAKVAGHHADGVGPCWFAAFVASGIAAAAAFAAGPALALRRLRPRGPAVTFAVRAAAFAAVTMALAGAVSMAVATGLYLWAPRYGGYHQAWPLQVYLPMVVLAAGVALVGASRGIRATRGESVLVSGRSVRHNVTGASAAPHHSDTNP
jgi:hypothetical protein